MMDTQNQFDQVLDEFNCNDYQSGDNSQSAKGSLGMFEDEQDAAYEELNEFERMQQEENNQME